MPEPSHTIEQQLLTVQATMKAVYQQLFEIQSMKDENIGDPNNAHYAIARIKGHCNDISKILKEQKLAAVKIK